MMSHDPRPRATSAFMAAAGCVSSVSPRGAPMLIANTSLAYRVWLRDGLESRTCGAGLVLPTIVPLASRPDVSANVRATILGGIYGI